MRIELSIEDGKGQQWVKIVDWHFLPVAGMTIKFENIDVEIIDVAFNAEDLTVECLLDRDDRFEPSSGWELL